MTWKDQLKRFKGEWDKFNAEHNILPGNQAQQAQQPYDRPPPQPQYGSHDCGPSYPPHPPHPPIGTVYWQPRFEPGFPVTQEWDAKLGNNNGWGNNELQNYTANPENSFFTSDGKLILRAIANSNASDDAQKYTSARLVSRQTLARDRGVLTAVVSSPCARGIWPAFWLLPFEPFTWPTDGEMDIAETWNGDKVNHSCLHWGFFNDEDRQKHRVIPTPINDMDVRPVRYDFAWEQPGGQAGQGRLLWYIDGRPVMKATIPSGTRPMRDFQILFNVAMGGNVNGGNIPGDGAYDMVVHYCALREEPENGGWGRFHGEWGVTQEGNI